MIVDGRALVPLRFFSEALGAKVSWNDADRSILFENDSRQVLVLINRLTAYINNRPVEIETAPRLVNNRTLVPVRFICEVLGFDVQWDESAKSVIIAGIKPGNTGLVSGGSEPANSLDQQISEKSEAPRTQQLHRISSPGRLR
jgi:hypothetical protein